MKLYHILNQFYGTQADAKAAAKAGEVKFDPAEDTVEVPTDKEGLIDYLNGLIRAQRNAAPGEDQFVTVVERQDPPVEQGEAHTDKLVRFEDEFAALPLAAKLHYAALALEDARELVPTLKTEQPVGSGLLQANAELAGKPDLVPEDDELFS